MKFTVVYTDPDRVPPKRRVVQHWLIKSDADAYARQLRKIYPDAHTARLTKAVGQITRS